MKQHIIVYACAATILLGGIFNTQPPRVLTSAQMVNILTDLEIAEAMIQHHTEDQALAEDLLKSNRHLIYKMYDTDEAMFQRSCAYYLDRLGELKKIYAQVVERLEELAEEE